MTIHPQRIFLSSPHMGGDEIKFVQEAFDTNWIAPVGPHIPAFESDIAAYISNGVYVAALQSGTAAIHLALRLLGVERGDEVLCQSLTFSASANPIIYEGATPIFIDSERSTWNICPDELERAILDRISAGVKPKAFIIVHLYGMPANLQRLMALSNKYNIPIIEDAAEAFGSAYNGQKLGSFGAMSVLSFNGNKIITTSGGGALLSADKSLVEKARFLATQARDPAPHYEHSQIGYNYRLSNVCAGIGRGQMKVLDQRVEQRRRNYDYYRKALAHTAIEFPEEPDKNYFSNRWLTTVLLPDESLKEKIINGLSAKNIESRPVWKPMHLQPVFSRYIYYGKGVSDDLFSRGLCLPSGSNLATADLERICEEVQKLI